MELTPAPVSIFNFEVIPDPSYKEEEESAGISPNEKFPILFAVDAVGKGWLVDGPPFVVNELIQEPLGSMEMDEAGFSPVPEEPGFYKATAQFHYYKGYYEGYYEPGESWWEFALTGIERIMPNA